MDLSCLLFALVPILTIIYWLLTRKHNHWQKQNVPSIPNPLPVLGHMLPTITLRESFTCFINKAYKATNASVIGFHFAQRPAIIVREPELVKSVLQTHFSSFRNNIFKRCEKSDPILSENPFFVTDPHKWKEARNRTSNNLTGKKLRYLFIIIQEVCSKMTDFTNRKIKENSGSFECELKDYFVKCTGEVVANSAFAMQGQSFEDNPDRLSFATIARTLFHPTPINGIKQALLFYLPGLANLFSMSFLEPKAAKYFQENMKVMLKQRKQSSRPALNDFLQFCIETNDEDDVDSIVADVIIFYVDVYETSSTTLAILFYHLSQYKEIQTKLRAHIIETLEKHQGAITYKLIKDLVYLDQVLLESMRQMPTMGAQIKECTKEITLTGSDGLKCHLQPGDPVFIPTWSLHNDSQYWQDPEVFDPDRFNVNNQVNRNKYVFLPFGGGPRMCVGMRLAVMMMKLATVSLLLKYSIEPSKKMRLPLELDPMPFLTYIQGGLWAKFEKLNGNNSYNCSAFT